MTSNLPGRPQRLLPAAATTAELHGPVGLAVGWGCRAALAAASALARRGVQAT
uniref:hypothetical protein n=1 Tax=uncultured Acidovorax sp. TaxID=158751 RepID=UPI0030FBC305